MYKKLNGLLKKGQKIFGILIVLLSIFNTNSIANATTSSSKDWGDQFITHAELEDENGNPKTEFGLYDNMQAHWDFTIPAGTDIHAGDIMTVKVPDVLTLQSDITFDIKDKAGNVIGHAVANHTTGEVKITFTDYAEESASNGIAGDFNIWVHWNHSTVDEDTTVPVDWGNGGSTDIDIDPGNDGPDPDEKLYKWGWYDSEDPTIIHWRVRLNYAKSDIQNAVYTDFVGGNQTLITGSIAAYHVVYDPDGSNFSYTSSVPDSDVIEDGDLKFHVNLNELTDTVIVDYETKATDGGASTKYENYGELTGDNIETQTVDVYSPDNGGGGGGDTTVSVTGKKTWVDNNNASGVRPNSIIIDLYRNEEKIDSKEVTATDAWSYNFSHLTKYDENGNEYHYTVKEEQVDGYIPTIDGYNIINTRISSTINLTAKKVLQGKDLASGEFSFELKDSDGKVIQTQKNDGKGQINFDTLNYDKAGTYSYTITEVKGNATGISYDKHEIKVKVTVVEKDGKLVATAAYAGNQTFTNIYKPVTPDKPSNVLPDTGETVTGLLTTIGCVATGSAVLLYIKRNKHHE